MNVASLEICKELYELSGWGKWSHDGRQINYRYESNDTVEPSKFMLVYGVVRNKEPITSIPAYDLGYLLRKLQGNEVQIYEQVGERWTCLIGEGDYATNGDTPEDAACKLAIELFKSGVLK